MCPVTTRLNVSCDNTAECVPWQHGWMCPVTTQLNVSRSNMVECVPWQHGWMCPVTIRLNVSRDNTAGCVPKWRWNNCELPTGRRPAVILSRILRWALSFYLLSHKFGALQPFFCRILQRSALQKFKHYHSLPGILVLRFACVCTRRRAPVQKCREANFALVNLFPPPPSFII